MKCILNLSKCALQKWLWHLAWLIQCLLDCVCQYVGLVIEFSFLVLLEMW
jgi:hypothetical protein